MRRYYFLILFLTVLKSYFLVAQETRYNPRYSVILDSSSSKELLMQCSRSTPGSVNSFWTPDSIQIDLLFGNFRQILYLSSLVCCNQSAKVLHLESYAFQFCGIEIKGKRYIYINAFQVESENDFRKLFKNWRVSPVRVCDGGDSFWGALFDTDTGKFSQLAFNGSG